MQVLVDTSIWVDHLRAGEATLVGLLQAGVVCCHPMVLGELACGNLQHLKQLLGLLHDLRPCIEATHAEVLHLIDQHALMGKGIGFVDAHLLASCLLTGETLFWTRDKRLAVIAQQFGIGYVASSDA